MSRTSRKNGREEKCIMLLVGKPERKRLLGRPTRSLAYSIKTDLRVIGKGRKGDWINLARVGPLEYCFEHGNKP
jgi:hypothetical protein